MFLKTKTSILKLNKNLFLSSIIIRNCFLRFAATERSLCNKKPEQIDGTKAVEAIALTENPLI